jgi:creatinine amidohydrolase
VHRLEDLSTAALDALDRARSVVMLTVSPPEEHGPHLPVGVDLFAARHFAEAVAGRLVAARPGWNVLLAPTLPLGSFAFDAAGTLRVRQRVVRDALVDWGASLARAGFRYILVANGHGGPTHLTALEEAAAIVSRRHGVMMASFTGHLAWQFLRGRYVERIEEVLGRPFTSAEREALREDAHAGWWETSLMLLLRPDLVGEGYRNLEPARYALLERVVPNYPLRDGGLGYVGHPARADAAFARAASEVLLAEAVRIAEDLLDGRVPASERRSPLFAIPVFRTNFARVVASAGVLAVAGTALWLSGRDRSNHRVSSRSGSRR